MKLALIGFGTVGQGLAEILRDKGESLKTYLGEFDTVLAGLKDAKGDDIEAIHAGLSSAYASVGKAAQKIGALSGEDLDYVAAASAPFLKGLATAACGMMMGRAALAAQALLAQGGADHAFLEQKILHARFFAETFLPVAAAQAQSVLTTPKTVVSARF